MSASLHNRYDRIKSAKINSVGKFLNTNENKSNIKQRKTQSSFHDGQHQQINRIVTNIQSTFFDNRQSRLREKSTKQPERLFEQNLHLKNQLHTLNKKFMIQIGKIQVHRKKNNIYCKKLNRQFQKELYWQSNKNNDYLITGIKHQYQKMKLMYQQKCRQCQQIRKTLSSTKMQQLTIYCQALQTENNLLIQNLSYMKINNKKQYPHQQFSTHKTQKLKSKIQKMEQKITKQQHKERQFQKKIQFLEKTMIQKDNNAHSSYRKQKVIKKQNQRLTNVVKQLQIKIQEIQHKFQLEFQENLILNNKKVKIQKEMFENSIKQKNDHIQKLQKQIGYLSTLLSYWKPLDQINYKDSLQLNRSSLKQKNSSIKLKQSNNNNPITNQNFIKTKTTNKQVQSQKYIGNDLKILNEEQYNISKDMSFHSISMDEDIIKSNKTTVIQPKRSNRKWCDAVKKCRKITLPEIQHLGQLIRYKMIGQQQNIQDVKGYFSRKIDGISSPNLSQQLITMKEINDILKSDPFNLCEQDSFKLSRYLSEEQGGQFVYCHQENEIQRSIVKSILKNFIGQYQTLNQQQFENKWINVKKFYCYNIQLALKSIYPKGIISKNKLIQLFKSLGIQIQDQLMDYIIGKLIRQVKSLSELSYQSLFTTQQQIN